MPNWIRTLENAESENGLHYRYPATPFECNIPGGLKQGTKIYIHGVATSDAERFAINLQTGSDATSDIVFHLNPRFDESDVVMNTRSSDEWGSEERTGNFIIHRTEPFLVGLTVTAQGYELEINGEHVNTFEHRLPLDKATHLFIERDIIIIGVHIPSGDIPKDALITIPGGVQVDHIYTLTAKTNSDFSGFYLNLQCGDSIEDNIALHFNPRYGDNKVIRNSYISGEWGAEEREGDFPFAPDQQFALNLSVHKDYFQIRVNGKELAKYSHRLDISSIRKLTLRGDARLRDAIIEITSTTPYQIQSLQVEMLEPTMPVIAEIKTFKPGNLLSVRGRVDAEPTRFRINLQSGPGEEDDVMLHLNPRWDQGDPKMVINSREDGNWANEALWDREFLLKPGSRFEIDVLCNEGGYEISIDGRESQFVNHRMDCQRVRNVLIDGSLTVEKLLVR